MVNPAPFSPAPGAAAANQVPGQSSLQLSGNTSATGYMLWTETTQTIDGTWKRIWTFLHNPLSPSSCGDIEGSYISYHCNVQVNRAVGQQTFASGLTVLHNVAYFSDELTGGWGTSGAFYTASAGYTRVSGEYGPSGLCMRTWDSVLPLSLGQYDLNSTTFPAIMDTSSDWNASFNSNISLEAQQLCPNWNPNIVII